MIKSIKLWIFSNKSFAYCIVVFCYHFSLNSKYELVFLKKWSLICDIKYLPKLFMLVEKILLKVLKILTLVIAMRYSVTSATRNPSSGETHIQISVLEATLMIYDAWSKITISLMCVQLWSSRFRQLYIFF